MFLRPHRMFNDTSILRGSVKQRKRNRIPRRRVTRVVGMQMISAVVFWKQTLGTLRVSQNLVEIDHPIEFSAFPYPRVELLAHTLLLGSIKADHRILEGRVLERRNRRGYDSNSFFMRPCYHLTIAGHQALSAHTFGGR